MTNRLLHIMVIDDADMDLYLAQRIISKTVENTAIKPFISAVDALEFINDLSNVPELPNLIFLDINMPIMNGFEFLEAISKIDCTILANSHIYMLTSSFNPADKEKALSYATVKGFIEKPLPRDLLKTICEERIKTLGL